MKSPDPHTARSLSGSSARWIAAKFSLSAVAASLTLEILLWVAEPYAAVWPNYAVIYGLYPPVIALLFGIPVFLLVRRRAVALWLIVPAAALVAGAPLAILSALSSSRNWADWWPVRLEAVAGAMGGLAYWAMAAPNAVTRRRLRLTVWGVLALLAAGAAGWSVAWHVDDYRRAPWEGAEATECPLMALALSGVTADEHLPRLPPLYADARTGGPCDWRAFDLDVAQGVRSDLYLSSDGSGRLSGRFTPHLILGRPVYSLAHLRASVPVIYRSGALSVHSYACHFHRSLSGWAAEGCSLDGII